MANEAIKSFQQTVKPFLDHKNAYTAEKGFTGQTTEGGVPQSEEREKIMAGREFQKKITDVPMSVLGTAWNIPMNYIPKAFTGRDTMFRYGKDNWILQSKQDKINRKSELTNAKLYRERRDRVRDDILEMAEAGKQKYLKTGDEKYLNMVTQAANDILANE